MGIVDPMEPGCLPLLPPFPAVASLDSNYACAPLIAQSESELFHIRASSEKAGLSRFFVSLATFWNTFVKLLKKLPVFSEFTTWIPLANACIGSESCYQTGSNEYY